MKLLLENWRKYLAETNQDDLENEVAALIRKYNLDEKGIKKLLTLKEEEDLLNEAIGQDLANLYKKYGKNAVAGALAAMAVAGSTMAPPAAGGSSAPDSGIKSHFIAERSPILRALNRIVTNSKIPIDIRFGAKFLLGAKSESTNKNLTRTELDFLTNMVSQKTDGGYKRIAWIGYGDWDKAAKGEHSADHKSSLYSIDNPATAYATADACDISKAVAGEALPGFCYGQPSADSIVSGDIAVQMKRVFGEIKVTEVADGKYELAEIYNFNKGQSAGVVAELIELIKDLTDIHNDQKAYTAMRRLFQLRHETGYKGYPIKIVVDLGGDYEYRKSYK